jgi:hypothetical protein
MRGFSRVKSCINSQRLICIYIILGILAMYVSAIVGIFLVTSDDGQACGAVLSPTLSEFPNEPWQAGNPENGEMTAQNSYIAVFTGMQRFFNPNINGVFIQVNHFGILSKISCQQAYQLLNIPPPLSEAS